MLTKLSISLLSRPYLRITKAIYKLPDKEDTPDQEIFTLGTWTQRSGCSSVIIQGKSKQTYLNSIFINNLEFLENIKQNNKNLKYGPKLRLSGIPN